LKDKIGKITILIFKKFYLKGETGKEDVNTEKV